MAIKRKRVPSRRDSQSRRVQVTVLRKLKASPDNQTNQSRKNEKTHKEKSNNTRNCKVPKNLKWNK